MSNNLDKLPVCIKVYRILKDVVWDTEYPIIEGNIVSDNQTTQLLNELKNVGIIEGVKLEGKKIVFSDLLKNCKEGQRIYLTISYPHNLFAKSLDGILNTADNRQKIPSDFYIAEYDYCHSKPPNSIPNEIKDYISCISLIELLEAQADLTKNDRYFYLSQRKVELEIAYSSKNIKGIGELESISLLIETMKDKLHQGEKQ